MAAQDNLYETIKATVLAHAKGYSAPKPFDNDTIQKYRTPDCLHYLHPVQSIPAPFNQAIDKTMFTGFMSFFGNCLDRTEFNVKELVIDTGKLQAVMYIDAVFDFKAFDDEPALSNYMVQYMWMLETIDDGTKVKRVEEFLDPDRLMNYVKPRAERYAAWAGKQDGN